MIIVVIDRVRDEFLREKKNIFFSSFWEPLRHIIRIGCGIYSFVYYCGGTYARCVHKKKKKP